MDETPPSPPLDTSDVTAAEIEIPEPDYDDDSGDDDATDPASGCHDNEPDESSQPETCSERVDDDDDEDTGEVDVGKDDDNVDDSLDFDGVRSKLEAFSRQKHLRGSVSAADQDVDIPEPDYSDSDDDQLVNEADNEIQSQLISAKKLANPCLESKEHEALRRELAFNQKLHLYQLTHVRVTRGVSVLDNKSELRKEMEKRKQRQQRRDDYQRQRQNRSSFELRLEQQASKLDLEERRLPSSDRTTTAESPACVDGDQTASEFLRVHAKINQAKSAS